MIFRKRLDKTQENVHLDRYLITYADLITLLLGLFVILYMSSKVDEEKFKELSNAFSEYFQPEKIADGGAGVFKGIPNGIPEPIMPYPSKKSLEQIQVETERSLKKYVESGLMSVTRTGNGLTLTLSEKLLFKSGKAEVEPEGMNVIDTLAQILRGIDKQISIDGHTDSDPIRSFRYESNWHLSVARAVNVGYLLVEKGLPENNLMLRGFGAQRPIALNSTIEGKAKNRRVEINITEFSNNAPSTEGYKQSK
ncbi:MAG: OmpA family protein [Candidatus Kapabacteria bacterium]|nr:OmpA family protein [Candidatus Kapabacteria bacterium]